MVEQTTESPEGAFVEVGHRKTKVTVVEGARDLCLARVKEDFYCLFISSEWSEIHSAKLAKIACGGNRLS